MILIKRAVNRSSIIQPSEITSKEIFEDRRRIIRAGVALAGVAAGGALPLIAEAGKKLPAVKVPKYSTTEKPSDYNDVTTYNNFYEFGTDKAAPARLARNFKSRPWTLTVDGEVNKPATYEIDDLIRQHQLEERIYRFRCVEAWSMVVPWIGIPLHKIIERVQPTGKAKYIQFVTLHDPEQMPGQRPGLLGGGLAWPYREGLRMDEAMHPLTLLTVGIYGEVLPNQNGAPVRLVVPWKYGFKSIKSIVRIRFVEKQPATTWNHANSREYGFYSNVNPNVDHPRWSQKRERRLGDSIFTPKRDTLMFNGYADEVASLYSGMDLNKYI